MFHNATIFRFVALSSDTPAVAEKILSFSDLPVGWHYGSGEKISPTAIIAALSIVYCLRTLGVVRIETFPNINGGVLISGYKDEETLDILCQSNGRFNLIHDNGSRELADEPNLSFHDVSAYIRALPWQSMKSSDSYTHYTTVMNSTDLRARPLNYPMTGFQSLTQNVAWQPVETFAPISTDSIQQIYQAAPQYFYDSEWKKSQRAIA